MNCENKDLEIQIGENLLYLTLLHKDTDFFHRACYRLDPFKSTYSTTLCNIDKNFLIKWQGLTKNCFISAKIKNESSNNKFLSILYFLGFYYVGTEAVLEGRFKKELAKNPGILSAIIETKDKAIVLNDSVPKKLFEYSRFHMDCNISTTVADEYWNIFLRDAIKSDDNTVFLAQENNEIAGFILVNNAEKCPNMFMVATMEKYRNQGIGSRLIQHVGTAFYPKAVRTEVYLENLRGINFYLRNGCTTFIDSRSVFHYWG